MVGDRRTSAALVGKVVGGTIIAVSAEVEEGLDNIVDVHGVNLHVTAPEELHLLVEVLVDGAAEDARS
jgi:hypothetical protein